MEARLRVRLESALALTSNASKEIGEMILTHCLKCEYHSEAKIDDELHSKCDKENCLSVYSNCIRAAAVKKFVSKNKPDRTEEQSSALDICYPRA